MTFTRKGPANGNGTASFGAILEKRGDYENARRAFESAAMGDDAHRVECKIAALALAKRFEDASLPHRAARILLDNGLEKEAIDFADRLPEDKPNERFAKGLIWARTGQTSRLGVLLEPLQSWGPHGKYLIGKILAEINTDGLRYVADSLSGKPNQHELALEIPDNDEEAEKKMLISMDNPTQAANEMLSIIMWGHSSESEMLYYALRLYQRLDDMKEARRCLTEMRELAGKDSNSIKFYLSGLFALEGKEAVLEKWPELVPEENHTKENLLTFYYARDGVDCFKGAFGFWHKDDPPTELYADYVSVIHGESSLPIMEFVGDEELLRLVDVMAEAKERALISERAKLAEYHATLTDILDFSSIQRASEILRSINLNLLAGGRKEGAMARSREHARLADIASGFQDKESQLFAGEMYARNSDQDKALACARKLLTLGEESEATKLIKKASGSMPTEDILALADELESSHPLISLELYFKMGNKPEFVRLAQAILAQDNLEAIENVAWKISIAWQMSKDAKRSLLMQKALHRLEEFGGEGVKKAQMVRLEMGIGHLFVSTGLDTISL